MFNLKTLTILQTLLFTVNATANPPRIIHTFPNPTWLENIAATRNGSLLTGVLSSTYGASIHLIDPFTPQINSSADSTILHTFPSADSVFGITELSPDIYAVATGLYNTTTGPTQNSSSIWTLDLNTLWNEGKPTVRKVADLEDAMVINGLAALNAETVLAADSYAGTIVAINVSTGNSEVLHDDISLAPNMSATLPIGVNGMKYLAPNLYYTNTQLGVFRVRVDAVTGAAVGPYEMLAEINAPDDVAVVEDGTVFVARPLADMVERVGRNGSAEVVVSEGVRGVTALTLGRSWRDRGVVYACMFGGYAEDGVGFASGGKVVAFDMV